MRLAVGSDHAGYEAKEHIKRWLANRDHVIDDVGTHGSAAADYPDYAARAAHRVAAGEADLGILVCGSGIGMAIVANKVPGVRAAVCTEPYSAGLARRHNDANILCMGARVTGLGMMEEILQAFLTAAFEGGRHAARVDKIARLESAADGDERGERARGVEKG